MQKSSEEQMQKIFQSLFSKEQLRKNLYLYQHLNPDMTLKAKAIYQQRKVAALSKDPNFIHECLKQCPYVKLVNPDSLCILISGDALVVHLKADGEKPLAGGELKKIVMPMLKDIKNQIREGTDGDIEIEFQSETSVTQFIQRLKSKGASIKWQLKQKDPYECIKKSIRYLLKQRKNQQESSYPQHQHQPQPYYPQNYYQGYQGNQYGYQGGRSYGHGGYQNSYQQSYQVFIRRAVDSDEEDREREKELELAQKQKNGDRNHEKLQKVQVEKEKNKEQVRKQPQTKSGKNAKNIKFDSQDFPQL